MTYRERQPAAAMTTTEKLMQTFRMSRNLVDFLKGEATRRGLDLTAYVTRVLEGLRNHYGLPGPASRLLDEDREALGVDGVDYLLHLLYERSIVVREKGPGFDGKRAKR